MDAGAWAYREWGKLSHHFPSFFLLGQMEQVVPKDTDSASTEDQAASQASIAMFFSVTTEKANKCRFSSKFWV